MAESIIRYSVDDLLRLRDSPLVKKPDDLPSIEQWMESVLSALCPRRYSDANWSAEHHSNKTPSGVNHKVLVQRRTVISAHCCKLATLPELAMRVRTFCLIRNA